MRVVTDLNYGAAAVDNPEGRRPTMRGFKIADDEGRTLLHELFDTAADIAVADGELRLTLHPLSSPHRTLAVETLCETLTAAATAFPYE